jgi:predicted nucleotidyltransferase
MKRVLKKLPAAKRRELDRAVEIVLESFAKATATRKADRLRDGRILKIILYGSYARGDWVHDPVGRYFSDFDLLVVVDHEDLLDIDFWEEAEARLLDELSGGAMRTPVSFIVHSLDDVNWKLEHGRAFFIDIVRDGVVLKDTPGAPFVDPQPLPPETALEEAEEHFAEWTESVEEFLETAKFTRERGFTRKSAFQLHQATETRRDHGRGDILTGLPPIDRDDDRTPGDDAAKAIGPPLGRTGHHGPADLVGERVGGLLAASIALPCPDAGLAPLRRVDAP